jgi:membrane peptidoglycan carboxypeptidase
MKRFFKNVFRFLRALVRAVFTLALLALLAVVAVYGISGYRMYREALATQSLADKVAEIRAKPGYTLHEDLPLNYIEAVVAVEDRRFYLHRGVDPISIARALWVNVSTQSLKEGGSTITQQLAKNLYFTQEKRFARKVAEAFMAIKIEHTYTKNEILELYVNSIYFGDGYYCVRDASQGYFGKEPEEMTLSECALLAGIPNAPSVYSLTRNPVLAYQRQQEVLRSMVEYGCITEEKAEEVIAESQEAAAAAIAASIGQ